MYLALLAQKDLKTASTVKILPLKAKRLILNLFHTNKTIIFPFFFVETEVQVEPGSQREYRWENLFTYNKFHWY